MGAPAQGMYGLSAGLSLGVLALGVLAASVGAAAGAQWPVRNLGPFELRAPASMALTQGGIDSMAGALADDRLRLDFDFGLNTDSLQAKPGATDYRMRTMTVDGLPAHLVTYSVADNSGPAQFCAGVHVPQVRRSSIGRIGLTLLACGGNPDSIRQAQAIFSTLRFHRDTPR